MEPFSAAVITSLTNDLAKQVVGNLKGTLKTKLVGAPAEQALRRSLGVGIVALIAQATAAQPEEEVLLHDIFTEFFQYKAVRTQIDGLLNGQPLDHGRLKTLFDAAGFDADKLPHLDLDAGLDAFAAAFLAAAAGEPELQGALQIGKLQQALGVQQALLLEMKGLADVLREQTAVAVRAGQVLAEGRARPLYQWHTGKYVGQDEVHGSKIVMPGDFRGATIHIVNQYLSAPGERLWNENDFRDALNTYLTVIEETYAKPELRGNIEVKDRMPDVTLEKMYYSLAVLDKPEAREEFFEEQAGKSERTPGQEPKQPVNMATLLRSRRRLVITGKPGSGKSTYLYLTASAVARALLGKGTELVDKHVGLAHPLPLPIFISLGEFNEYRKEPPDPGDPRHGTLLAYASNKAIKKYEAFVPKDFFERLIVGNQMCLFLLDGLDEIADETERQHVSEEIRSLSRNPKIGPVIVACRSWAYVGDTRLHAPFVEYEVQAMSAEQAQTKGKVESGVKYVRGNFWPGLFFDDLADLNRQGWNWLEHVANVRVHGTTGDVPFVRLAQEALQPLASKPDYDTSLVCYRRSTKDCLVSYEGNQYSVPASHARQRLLLKETEQGELDIYALDGRELARHSVLTGHRQQSIIAGHYQTLRVNGPARPRPGAVQGVERVAPARVPDAPLVEKRALYQYEAWAEVTAA